MIHSFLYQHMPAQIKQFLQINLSLDLFDWDDTVLRQFHYNGSLINSECPKSSTSSALLFNSIPVNTFTKFDRLSKFDTISSNLISKESMLLLWSLSGFSKCSTIWSEFLYLTYIYVLVIAQGLLNYQEIPVFYDTWDYDWYFELVIWAIFSMLEPMLTSRKYLNQYVYSRPINQLNYYS